MRFFSIILIFPFFLFSQNKYQKNKHVQIETNIVGKDYVIEYLFKDHFNDIHDISFRFDKQTIDHIISQFGIPYSMFDRYEVNDENLRKHKRILKDGLFKQTDNKLELDYDAVVSFYKPYCKVIADELIRLLKIQNKDNTLNRIEMAMKFIQDIPYAIPRKNRKIYKNGCLAPLEVLVKGYGDCDSKTLLFASILTHMIDSDRIIFIKGDKHVLTAIHYDEKTLRKSDFFRYNGKKHYICETAGPGRRLFGEKSLSRKKYSLSPLKIQ